jgi:hypothetical protein
VVTAEEEVKTMIKDKTSSNQEIIEEQSQRLYSLYGRKSKSFRSAMISVFGLVAIVFVLIFYPYVKFRGTRYALEAELNGLKQNIASLEERPDEHSQLIETFGGHEVAIKQTFEGFHLEKLQGAAADHHQKKVVIGWLERLQNKVRDCFGHKRSSHLRNELFIPLYKSLTKMHGKFRDWLLGTVPSWEVDGDEARGSLLDHFSFFRDAYLKRIDNHHKVIVGMKGDKDAKLLTLKTQREDTEKKLKPVINRLKEMKNLQDIQTPFGQLPVGINDLVLLFPVLVAAGFLLMASLFSETLQLRQAYHQMCRLRDPEEEILDSKHVALVTPVWIDPLQSKLHRVYRIAILALPAVIFVAAIILLLVNRLLWGAFMEEVRLGTIIYAALYTASSLLIVEGSRRVLRALNAYDVNRI